MGCAPRGVGSMMLRRRWPSAAGRAPVARSESSASPARPGRGGPGLAHRLDQLGSESPTNPQIPHIAQDAFTRSGGEFQASTPLVTIPRRSDATTLLRHLSQLPSSPIWRRAKNATVVTRKSAGRGSDSCGRLTAAIVAATRRRTLHVDPHEYQETEKAHLGCDGDVVGKGRGRRSSRRRNGRLRTGGSAGAPRSDPRRQCGRPPRRSA